MAVLRQIGIALLILLLFASPARADSPTVSDISNQLICQCGCTLVLANCTHEECMSQESMTAFIKQELDRGQSEPQIMQSFVARYGEQVLASPPKKGFNLAAWITPFAAIVAGGAIIYFALRKWVRRGRIQETDTAAEAEEGDEQYQLQLREELHEFTERGFR